MYEEQLDIRSLVSVDTSLALLLSLLLSRPQMRLFESNASRSVQVREQHDTSASSDNKANSSLPTFRLKPGKKLTKKDKKRLYDELIGFQIDTELDRKLVEGVFPPVPAVDHPEPLNLSI